ncbi:hypothetical protein ACHQM5_013344 [Ranunculus cassubicifolius]
MQESDERMGLMSEEITGIRSDVDGVRSELKALREENSGIRSLLEKLDVKLQSLPSSSEGSKSESTGADRPTAELARPQCPIINGRNTDRPNHVTRFPDRPRSSQFEAPRGFFFGSDNSGHRSDLRSTPMNLYAGGLKTPKVEFPPFDGSRVRKWIPKTDRFFHVSHMLEAQKVVFASLFFTGRAESWFQTNPLFFQNLLWPEFLNREYDECFEELQPLHLQRNKGLTETFFIESYINGLKPEVRNAVQMFTPTSLPQAMVLARLQQAMSDSLQKNTRGMNSVSKYSAFNSSAATSSHVASNRSPMVSHVPTSSGHTKGLLPISSDSLLGKALASSSVPKKTDSSRDATKTRERHMLLL